MMLPTKFVDETSKFRIKMTGQQIISLPQKTAFPNLHVIQVLFIFTILTEEYDLDILKRLWIRILGVRPDYRTQRYLKLTIYKDNLTIETAITGVLQDNPKQKLKISLKIVIIRSEHWLSANIFKKVLILYFQQTTEIF